MALLMNVAGEIEAVFPGGKIVLTETADGFVICTGSEERGKFRWYLDKLKAMREAFKTGRAPKGFKIVSTEPWKNKAWHLKMIDAAVDSKAREMYQEEIKNTKGKPFIIPGPGDAKGR